MTPPTRRLIAAALAVILAGALAVALYVTRSGPVHEAATRPPAVLAKLRFAQKPGPIGAAAIADSSGHLHKLSEFRGRYVLLNLWATWCAPCVRELPALARLQSAVEPNRLAVIPVNVGRSTAQETAAFLKSHDAALPVYVDSSFAFLRAFRAYGLPVTILIDPRGREIARATGAVSWDAKDSIAYFRSLARNPRTSSS